MADNITLDPGSGGATVATDDDGTAHHQYVKVEFGGDGTFTKVTSSAGLPVAQQGTWNVGTVTTVSAVTSITNTVTVDSELPAAAVLADNTSNPTAPAVGAFLMAWDGAAWDRAPGTSADGLLVNLGGNNDVTVTGSVTANAGTNLNTSALALESGGNLAAAAASLATLDNIVSGSEAQVDIVAALPAGTNNIGDVDVLTVPADPFGANADAASATGSISAKLRFIASTGIPITGTVTVGSHAVTNAGTFAVQVDGSALTALQLIDDVVVTEDAAHSSGDKGVMALAVRRDANTTLADTTGDYAPLQVDSGGNLKVAIISGAGSGGTSLADDAAFTAATTSFTPVGGIVTSDSVDSGDGGAFAMLANRQQKVTLYDSSGVELAVGGGTQYTEDAAAAANPVGNAIIVVRDDSRGGSLTTTDGDNVALRGTNAGELYVKHVDALTVSSHAVTNAGTFAVQVDGAALTALQLIDNVVHVDDAAYTLGTHSGVMMMGFAGTQSVDANDAAALACTTAGALHVSVQGTVTVGSHAVTNAGTFAVQVDGTALTRLTDIETNTDSGAVVGNGAAATAQRVTLANDSTGVLATVSTVTTVSTLTTLANGQTAHDSGVTGSPLRIGAKAETALSGITLVADGDATDLHAGVDGVLITRPHCNLEDIVSGVASNTDGASTEVIAAAGSGVKQYLTSCTLINSSSSFAYCELKSGTTVKWRFPVPATGGVTHTFNPPLPPNAANEAWNFDMSAATTTAYCSLVGFKSKV